MAGQRRVGGLIALKIDSAQYDVKGNVTYNLGKPKRDAVIGADGVHGYKETHQVAFVEGEITDNRELDLAMLTEIRDSTVEMQLGSGKIIVLNNAWFAGEGTANTEEGNIGFRFESKNAAEFN